MKTYTTTASVVIVTGILALSQAQARTRAGSLSAQGDGTYSVLEPIQFKAGETFGYDGEIPKVIAASLEEQAATGEKPLEALDRDQLFLIARDLGMNPAGNTGKAKLIEQIHAKQEENAQKAARIAELEAKGEERTEAETAELDALKG